ncbi:hypothetical protein AG0111_0g8965 [Alternaria gaisen]|uniref:Uncharacterized protein n=1 Tax=Alternaria gaisen TaxID=167740 RepID=A0ACB6FDM1_9PLEO|nr:hypothetical protein AG0111_0g8965 [Alternaria gaisen]
MISDQTDDAAKESNAGHRHFIKRLEDVLEIIKPKLPQNQRQPLKAAKTTSLHTSNAFEHLNFEEPLDTEDMPEAIESPVRPATQKISYKLEPSDTDVSFAIYCFLKDATHLRLAVRRTWREFAKGDIGLQAAAFTMNAALAMIEKLSNEFQQAHPRFKDTKSQKMHLEIINFIYSSYSESEKGPAFIDAGDEDSDPFAYKEGKQMLRSDTVMCTHTTELVIEIFCFGKNKEKLRLTNDEKRFLKCISQLVSTPDGGPMPDDYMIGQQLISRYNAYFDVEGLENVGATHVTFRKDIVRTKDLIEILVDDTLVQEEFDQFEKQTSRAFDNIPGFSLLKHDPALCGLISANMCDEYHRTAINMASNQGQIIVSAHFYNAVQRSGNIPEGLQWTDMNWLIERHGSDWMFYGQATEARFHFWKAYVETEYNVGGVRRLEYHARRCKLGTEREPRHKKPVSTSKAKNEILVMVECLVNDFRGKSGDTCKSLSSLEKLSVFKLAIEKDESAFAFDVMDLNLRCIRLLQENQKYALTFAPLDYPVSKFTGGLSMNAIIGDMLYDLGGHPRHHTNIFPKAAAIICKTLQEEGNNVLMNAMVCQEEMKLNLENFKAEVEPSFENPYEDIIDLDFRGMVGNVMLHDENRGFRMPFGRPV